ncbi:MAG: hypothetical protein ACYTE8_08785 [Planctomycetota bacterium]|jgi:hypothetical protein
MEKEEIKKLLEQFMESEKAEEAYEDIINGECLLAENPGPEPSEDVIRTVRAAIRERLAEEEIKKQRFGTVFKTAAVAAVLAILSFIGTLLFNQQVTEPIPIAGIEKTETLWESDNLFAGDSKMMLIDSEAKQIQNELQGIKRGESIRYGDNELLNIESDLVRVVGDFWER